MMLRQDDLFKNNKEKFKYLLFLRIFEFDKNEQTILEKSDYIPVRQPDGRHDINLMAADFSTTNDDKIVTECKASIGKYNTKLKPATVLPTQKLKS